MSAIDLLFRYVVISIAFQLACAWMHTFQSPWPLVDAFQLAPSVERQLFQSLGICFDSLAASLRRSGLTCAAQFIESRSAVMTICTAMRTIAHAAYSLSAPWRLTP